MDDIKSLCNLLRSRLLDVTQRSPQTSSGILTRCIRGTNFLKGKQSFFSITTTQPQKSIRPFICLKLYPTMRKKYTPCDTNAIHNKLLLFDCKQMDSNICLLYFNIVASVNVLIMLLIGNHGH